jgi:hypothetical protein
MRQDALKAFDAIKNTSTSTANDILRAEQAKHSALKKISEEQYGRQITLIEGMKKNWIAASVAIGAAMVVMHKSWELIKTGADYDETKGILDNLAVKYKTTADSIVSSMRIASENQIANTDLMKIALEGLAKGLKPDQIIKLAEASKLLGDTVGKSATVALTELTQALETGRIKGLKGYAGATIDLKDAFGNLADKLTAAEKANSMYALMMIHYTKLQKEQTKDVDEAADKVERLEAKYKNLTTTFSTWAKTAAVWLWESSDLGESVAEKNMKEKAKQKPKSKG